MPSYIRYLASITWNTSQKLYPRAILRVLFSNLTKQAFIGNYMYMHTFSTVCWEICRESLFGTTCKKVFSKMSHNAQLFHWQLTTWFITDAPCSFLSKNEIYYYERSVRLLPWANACMYIMHVLTQLTPRKDLTKYLVWAARFGDLASVHGDVAKATIVVQHVETTVANQRVNFCCRPSVIDSKLRPV